MIQLKSLHFFVLICAIDKFAFADERYEHISRFNHFYHSDGHTVILELFCGEKNIDRYLFYGDNLLEDSSHDLMSKLRYNEISVENCRFDEIQNDFFKEFKNVDTLNIAGVDLKKLDKANFLYAKNLKKLIASNNQLTEIPSNLFSNSPLLDLVDISNNSILRIDPLAFEGVSQLKTLNLSRNRIGELMQHWLSVTGILTLDLSFNNLKHLDEHALDEFTSLKSLNLSYNSIGKLEIGTFAYLINLEILSLKHTDITSIQMGTFLHQHKLNSLDLSENHLRIVDFDFLWPILHDLRSLRLNQNQLTDLSGFRNTIFPQLTVLDIRDNQFNCTYLSHFINSVDWTHCRMPIEAQSINVLESSIRGVNCKSFSTPESWQSNTNSDIETGRNEDQLEKLIEQIHNDNNFIKFLLVTVCICILVLFFFKK